MPSDDDNLSDSEGIKNLRKQFEEQAKELKALRDFKAEQDKAAQRNSVAEVLKAKGLPEKAASLYNGDDVSEGAVSKWLEDYADVFGAQSDSGTDANAAAAARAAATAHGETSGIQLPAGNTGRVLGNPEEILHLIKTQPYEELVKLGIMPARGTLHNPAY